MRFYNANAEAVYVRVDGDLPTMYQTDVFGLASAFLDHGVSVFIGPLWRIDDYIAAQTARIFYDQLLRERQTVGEALRRAKSESKRRYCDAASFIRISTPPALPTCVS